MSRRHTWTEICGNWLKSATCWLSGDYYSLSLQKAPLRIQPASTCVLGLIVARKQKNPPIFTLAAKTGGLDGPSHEDSGEVIAFPPLQKALGQALGLGWVPELVQDKL